MDNIYKDLYKALVELEMIDVIVDAAWVRVTHTETEEEETQARVDRINLLNLLTKTEFAIKEDSE